MDQGPLFDIIEGHLGEDPSRAIVIRNALAEPSDPRLQEFEVPRFGFDREVYHYLRGPRSRAEIKALMRVTSNVWRFGVLTVLSSEPRATVERAVLVDAARHASLALVSAWVGDGDLIWRLK